MKPLLTILFFLFVFHFKSFTQVGIGTTTPNSSSILDLVSTNKGFLPPRMTTAQRNLINAPVAGMMIFNTDSFCIEICRGEVWFDICSKKSSAIPAIILPSVTICNKDWTTNNLDVSTYRNGDAIPQVTDSAQWANLTTGAWCWYNNDSATYAAIYGKLYNWYAINDSRGLAPIGWHIPTDAEWNSLATCLDPSSDTTCLDCGQSSIAGGAMKDTGTTYWLSPNTGATNTSKFRGLPGGLRFDYGSFSNVGEMAAWWSSSSTQPYKALYHFLSYYNSSLGRNSFGWNNGFSVRCVKN